MTHLDDTIRYALRRAPDGLTAVTLADDAGEDYADVLAALKRLAKEGVVTRTKGRVGAWRLEVDQNPGEAA